MCGDFCLLSFCLTAPGKWKYFIGSPFGFLFHDSGYRESFLQVPKAHLLVVTILTEHYLSNSCGWLECPNFSGLLESEEGRLFSQATKRWIAKFCLIWANWQNVSKVQSFFWVLVYWSTMNRCWYLLELFCLHDRAGGCSTKTWLRNTMERPLINNFCLKN